MSGSPGVDAKSGSADSAISPAKIKASLPAIIIFCLAAAVGMGGIPALEPALRPPAALVVLAIGLWATGALQEHLVAVLFFLVAMIFSVSEPSVVFSGFAAGAFWLVFGGMVIGVAVERTGLGRRLARRILTVLSGSYGTIIGGLIIVSIVLAFLMPSTMGRIVLLLPVVMALADVLGFEKGSRGRTGMVLAVLFSSYLCSAAILPANVPNNVLIGAAEQQYGIQILYLDYLVLHFPVLGFLKALVVWAVTVWFYNDQPAVRSADEGEGADLHSRLPMSADERRLTILLIAALILWGSDAIHGISPAWISLAAGLACLLPWPGLVPPDAFRDKMQMSPLLYVAGILGVGALVAESGLGAAMSAAMLSVVPLDPEAPALAFAEMTGVAVLLGLASTMPGVPAIMTPIAGDLAAASGLPLETILMVPVLGFSTVLLPFQVPPLIVGLRLGGVSMAEGARMALATAAIGIFPLMPLNYFWWQFLGYLP